MFRLRLVEANEVGERLSQPGCAWYPSVRLPVVRGWRMRDAFEYPPDNYRHRLNGLMAANTLSTPQ